MIRPFHDSDLSAVVELFRACFAVSYEGVVPSSVRASMSESRASSLWEAATAASGPHNTMVDEIDTGDLLGVVRVSPPQVGDDTGTLESLYVAPEAQGQGTGRALLEAGLARLAGLGARRVQLWVFETNTGAQALYRHMGFTVDGRRRLEEAYGVWEIGMTHELKGREQQL